MCNHLYLRINQKFNNIAIVCDVPTLRYAWFENVNKHIPDIFALKISGGNIFIDEKLIEKIVNNFQSGTTFKLSLSSLEKRIRYKVINDFDDFVFLKKIKFIKTSNDELQITLLKGVEQKKETCSDINFTGQPQLRNWSLKYSVLPINIAIIGTCFSRSVFRSEAYFNPDYKKYFNVAYTAFHNSLISLMSEPIKDFAYDSIEDLHTEEVRRYIDVEFDKELLKRIRTSRPEIIIVDNYMEATAPIIKIDKDKYLTYNKYFQESIFKYNFSSCDILWPGSIKHKILLKDSFRKFRLQLQSIGLGKKVILLASRLCKRKIDIKNKKIELWTDKMSWINSSNHNWDIADALFIDEMEECQLIDMRNTKWMSDIYSPIIGGASPSHYQSGYYKEIFDKLKSIL